MFGAVSAKKRYLPTAPFLLLFIGNIPRGVFCARIKNKKIVFYFWHGNGYDRKQNSNIFAKEWIIMKIGFIGCGNMATAMLKGILKSGEVEK